MSPLSSDPRKRQRQLDNLTGRPPAPPSGNRRAVSNGGYARIAAERLEAKAAEVFRALSEDAPMRGPDGGLPPADAVSVRLLAECLCRLDDLAAYLRDRGLLDSEGNVRPAVELESRLRREAADHADALAMNPRSRTRLGLDVARGELTLAELMAQDEEREAADG